MFRCFAIASSVVLLASAPHTAQSQTTRPPRQQASGPGGSSALAVLQRTALGRFLAPVLPPLPFPQPVPPHKISNATAPLSLPVEVQFGYSAASIGDLDNDGIKDLAV